MPVSVGELRELLSSERLESVYRMPVHVGEFGGHIAIAPAEVIRAPEEPEA